MSNVTTTARAHTVQPSRSQKIGRTSPFLIAVQVVIIVLTILFALFPALWIISAALNPSGSMVSQSFIPQNVRSMDDLLTNFRRLFDDPTIPFWRWVGNSLVSPA